jgi:hypothetical protein
VANALTTGKAYLAKPSGDGYQNLLNAVDALTQTTDKQTLAASRVTNTQSQSKTLAILTVGSIGAHALLTLLEQKATSAQLSKMPAITARVSFDQIKEIFHKQVDKEMVCSELARKGYDPNAVLAQVGL